MYGYIYITYNKVNGKIYIGKRAGKYNEKYLGSGKFLLRAVKKHGVENFENYIIDYTFSEEDAQEKEKYWIKKYNSNLANGDGYNVASGGNGGDVFKYAPQEIKDDINYRKGRTLSKVLTGRKLSDAHRKAISESHKGLRANNAKPVIDTNTSIKYKSITEAANSIKCDRRAIISCLKKGEPVKLRDKRVIHFIYDK